MRFRRLHLLLILLAGLFAFQGSLAFEIPREKARTELVVRSNEQQVSTEFKLLPLSKKFFSFDEILTSSSHHLFNHSLIISYQHTHASL